MNDKKFTSPLKQPWAYFVPVFLTTLAVFILYGINIVKWRNSPDFGWRAMYESGPNVAADLFERAEAAGLRIGDNITAINGRAYSTFEELFFEIRDERPGAVNVYTVKRDGQEVEISITNGRLGLPRVLRRSGPLLFLGFVYFMIGAFFVTASNRKLWISIIAAMVIFSVFMLIVSGERGVEWDSIGPADLWYLPGIIYHFSFCGIYPVFPWIGFILIGIWLGRRDLKNPDLRKKLLVASLAVVMFTEGVSWIYFHKIIPKLSISYINSLSSWFIIDPWEPLPLFFLSGAGSAIIVICLSLVFAEKFRSARWLSLFVDAGQATLTLYVAHIPFGITWVTVMDLLKLEYPLFPIWGAVSFLIVAIIFSHQWKKHFSKGPLELLTRHFLTPPKRHPLFQR